MTRTLDDPTPRTQMTSIGGWTLGKTLGRGAYAHVRLATHEKGHKAACKILPALHRGKPYKRDQMMDAIEAHKELVLLKAFAGAGVPGIVGIEGVMSYQGWNFIFLELLPHSASNVKDWSAPDLFIPFFRRVCLAVQNLHKLDISHEDIKRSNVLVDSQFQPILADFGFSHFTPTKEQVRSLGGTADYSSPEKTRDDYYDPEISEVWSLGILLLRFLGRKHPWSYQNDDDDEDWRERLKREDPPIWDFKPHEFQWGSVGHLAKRMLAFHPLDRYRISQVLAHPFLVTSVPDPATYTPPPYNPSSSVHCTYDVVLDIAFLAFNNKEFFLCESLQVVEGWVIGGIKPWAQRWAGMLGMWKQRAETMWEDMPTAPRTQKSPVLHRTDNTKASRRSLRPLREIKLSPDNIPTKQVATTKPKADPMPVTPRPRAKEIPTPIKKAKARVMKPIDSHRPSGDAAVSGDLARVFDVTGKVRKDVEHLARSTYQQSRGEQSRQLKPVSSFQVQTQPETQKKASPVMLVPRAGPTHPLNMQALKIAEDALNNIATSSTGGSSMPGMPSKGLPTRQTAKSGRLVNDGQRVRQKAHTHPSTRGRGAVEQKDKENMPPVGERPATKAKETKGAMPLRRSARFL